MAYEQSVSWWCYVGLGVEPLDLLQTAKSIGYTAIELVPVEQFALVRDQGLKIAAHQLHVPLEQGISHTKYWDDIKRQADASLKLAVEWDIPMLIAFSGNREGLDDARGAENAIKQLEPLARMAESAGVVLILELLNSKVNHPDYQCDHTAWGVEVVSAVDSPNARLALRHLSHAGHGRRCHPDHPRQSSMVRPLSHRGRAGPQRDRRDARS